MPWKNTWTYTKESYDMDFELTEAHGPIQEVEMSEFQIGEVEENIFGEEVTRPLEELDPWAEDFELDGESFFQDMKPADIEQVNWDALEMQTLKEQDALEVEMLEEKQFEAEMEGIYDAVEEVGGAVEVGAEVAETGEVVFDKTRSAEVAEAVTESI